MSSYREQVAAALGAVTIHGPTRYAWLGHRSRPLPASIDAELNESERRKYLLFCLREELYVSFYCHGRPVPADVAPRGAELLPFRRTTAGAGASAGCARRPRLSGRGRARSVVLVAGEVGKTVLLRVLVEPGVGEDVAAVGGCATR